MYASDTPRLAEAVAEAAEFINAPSTVEERVRAVVQAAPRTIPGFDQASISVTYSDGLVETRAASTELVQRLDLAQYETAEGPCFDAFTIPGVVLVPSVRHEQRWPRYIPQAAQAGVRSQMAVPLRNAGKVRGALNLYSTTMEGIHPTAPDVAVLFATHVALALGWARTQMQLDDALRTRKVIGQAIGIVMERYQIDEAKAFQFLVRVSSTGNLKLRDVAQEMLGHTDIRYQRGEDS